MARETQEIDVHALGTVTFRPLGKVQMERLQEAAKRSSVSPLGDRHQKASTHEIEDALLVTQHMLTPKFASDAELLAASKATTTSSATSRTRSATPAGRISRRAED